MNPKTILMIHGMWGAAWHWDKYKIYFEKQGYHCLTPTLRFHDIEPGKKPDPRLGKTSITDYADDLEIIINQLTYKPIIIGHSMGGLLAQILASRDLAKQIILICPAAPAGIFSISPTVIKSFWSIQTKWAFWKKPHRQTFEEAAFSVYHNLNLEEQRETYQRSVYESGRAAAEIGYWFFDPYHATRINKKNITCPMLIIAGKKDRITSPRLVKKIYRKYHSLATYKEFSQLSHWMIAEPGWDKVVTYIMKWIKKIPG